MDYIIEKEKCFVREKLFEGASEQPVDLELSLPDYCPDVERILKCRICPAVGSANITGDRLDVDGTVTVQLYYLDSKKQAVRFCAHTSPFSCSFALKSGDTADCAARVRLRTEYLNCRAVSPRRLDIHGAFTVLAEVIRQGKREYCTSIGGSDIQQQLGTQRVSELKACTRQQFSISEVLDIGKGKGTPESILRSELNILIGDCRAIENKLMLKGEAVLKVLYVTDIETGAQDMMSFNVPFSQIIDAAGIGEGTVNDVSVDVLNYDVSLKSEFDESSTLLTLDARLAAVVMGYEDRDISAVEDAYSTDYELETVFSSESFERLAGCFDMTRSISGGIGTGEGGITHVIDIWCESISSVADTEGGDVTVRGKLNLCMLALDREGVPFCTDKALDFSFEPELTGHTGRISVKADLCVPNISFRITDDNNVDVRAELKMRAAVYETVTARCITDARADDDRVREKDKTAALTIYYADEGESLWDIARLYCTSVEAVRLENDLTEDVISARSMVMIPM